MRHAWFRCHWPVVTLRDSILVKFLGKPKGSGECRISDGNYFWSQFTCSWARGCTDGIRAICSTFQWIEILVKFVFTDRQPILINWINLVAVRTTSNVFYGFLNVSHKMFSISSSIETTTTTIFIWLLMVVDQPKSACPNKSVRMYSTSKSNPSEVSVQLCRRLAEFLS